MKIYRTNQWRGGDVVSLTSVVVFILLVFAFPVLAEGEDGGTAGDQANITMTTKTTGEVGEAPPGPKRLSVKLECNPGDPEDKIATVTLNDTPVQVPYKCYQCRNDQRCMEVVTERDNACEKGNCVNGFCEFSAKDCTDVNPPPGCNSICWDGIPSSRACNEGYAVYYKCKIGSTFTPPKGCGVDCGDLQVGQCSDDSQCGPGNICNLEMRVCESACGDENPCDINPCVVDCVCNASTREWSDGVYKCESNETCNWMGVCSRLTCPPPSREDLGGNCNPSEVCATLSVPTGDFLRCCLQLIGAPSPEQRQCVGDSMAVCSTCTATPGSGVCGCQIKQVECGTEAPASSSSGSSSSSSGGEGATTASAAAASVGGGGEQVKVIGGGYGPC